MPSARGKYKSTFKQSFALCRSELTADRIELFEKNTDQSSGCWIWTGGRSRQGYGVLFMGRVNGKARYIAAHRAAYVLAHGDIAAGLVVMHSCDVRTCVNPAHLSLGTQAQNVHDAAKKGVYNLSADNSAKRKLTDNDVLLIRESTENRSVLAEQFGVSPGYITQIKLIRVRRAA